MRDFSEETLMAYADGLLPEAEQAELAAAIEADATLAARVEHHRATRRLLRDRLAPLADEPLPPQLLALLQAPATPTRLRRPRATRRRDGLLALAAVLLLAIGLGVGGGWLRTGSVDPLAEVLETSASGQPQLRDSEQILALSTLERADGSICREYERSGDDGTARRGLACREGRNRWHEQTLPVSEEAAPTDGGYQLADGETDLALALGARRLGRAEEQKRLDSQWR